MTCQPRGHVMTASSQRMSASRCVYTRACVCTRVCDIGKYFPSGSSDLSVVIDEEPNIFLILVEVLVTRYACTQFQYYIYSICDRWLLVCVCIIQGLHLARSESENMPRIISGCSISKSYICIPNKKTELLTSQKWSWRAVW